MNKRPRPQRIASKLLAIRQHLGLSQSQMLRRLDLTVNDTAQYLVRPDGHVGYRAGGTDLTELSRYLDRWLPAPPPDPARPQ